jgi:hypothetical protein
MIQYTTDLERLAACVARAAVAMRLQAPAVDQTIAFLNHLILGDHDQAVMPCLQLGLISEIEARDLVMAHTATWLRHQNGVGTPPCDWSTMSEIEQEFTKALLGRPAQR